MGKKLYVGNLPYSVDDAALESSFSAFGKVDSARVITDRDTGRSKGFGFVEMESDDDAMKAIDGMNGQPLGGRNVTVSEARPQAPREGGGGGRGGPRGGGGGGGRGGPRGFGGGGGGNRY
jgi:RNA recognition motif-containing protein